jgi:hypothetical protein
MIVQSFVSQSGENRLSLGEVLARCCQSTPATHGLDQSCLLSPCTRCNSSPVVACQTPNYGRYRLQLGSPRCPGERRHALFLCGGRDKAPKRPAGIGIEPHDLPTIVDASGFSIDGVGGIDGGEGILSILGGYKGTEQETQEQHNR